MPQLSDPADRLVPQAGVSVALWLYGRGGTAPARAQHLDSRYVDMRRYLDIYSYLRTEGEVMRKPEGEGVAQSMGRSSTGSRVPATPSPLPEHRPLSSSSTSSTTAREEECFVVP